MSLTASVKVAAGSVCLSEACQISRVASDADPCICRQAGATTSASQMADKTAKHASVAVGVDKFGAVHYQLLSCNLQMQCTHLLAEHQEPHSKLLVLFGMMF